MNRFLLQMHGESGAGKSTLALAVGEATGAVVLDRDHIKGPLVEGGLEDRRAGGLGFDIFWSLAEALLAQGFNLVLDSGAFWPAIIERGRALAAGAGVSYYVVECRCDDAEEQERRLGNRERYGHQPGSQAELAVALSRPGVTVALQHPHKSIDTTQPLEVCVAQAVEYIGGG